MSASKSHRHDGKDFVNRWDFRCRRNDDRVDAAVTVGGRLFQALVPAAEKDQSPSVCASSRDCARDFRLQSPDLGRSRKWPLVVSTLQTGRPCLVPEAVMCPLPALSWVHSSVGEAGGWPRNARW